jgi:hypothetical protein
MMTRAASALAAILLAACSSSISQSSIPTGSPSPRTPLLYAYVPGAKTLVAAYVAGASGTTAPASVLAGGRTQLTAGNGGIAIGTDAQMYVLDGVPARLAVFAAGASGNVAPLRMATFSKSHLDGIALDASGNFWTVDSCYGRVPPGCGGLLRYPLAASGVTRPNLSLDPQLDTPIGDLPAVATAVATDTKGDVYCVCVVLYHGAQAIGITQYHIDAAGKPAIVRSFFDLTLPQIPPQSFTIDAASGTMYAASTFQPGIYAYPANQRSGMVTKRRVIFGTKTQLGVISALATDAAGELYVAQPKRIAVFAKSASEDVPPMRAIVNPSRLQYRNAPAGTFLVIR